MEIDDILELVKMFGSEDQVDRLKHLHKKYLKYKYQNFAYMTQQPPVINVYYDKDKSNG